MDRRTQEIKGGGEGKREEARGYLFTLTLWFVAAFRCLYNRHDENYWLFKNIYFYFVCMTACLCVCAPRVWLASVVSDPLELELPRVVRHHGSAGDRALRGTVWLELRNVSFTVYTPALGVIILFNLTSSPKTQVVPCCFHCVSYRSWIFLYVFAAGILMTPEDSCSTVPWSHPFIIVPLVVLNHCRQWS